MKNTKLQSVQRLAARIRSLREKAKWSQAVLAEKSGVTDGAIKMIETSRRQPRAKTLESIAAAFGISVEELYQSGEQIKPSSLTSEQVEAMVRSSFSEAVHGHNLTNVPDDILEALAGADIAQFQAIREAMAKKSEPASDTDELIRLIKRLPATRIRTLIEVIRHDENAVSSSEEKPANRRRR